MSDQMSVQVLHYQGTFALQTKKTSYLFHTLPTGHLEHLYYGCHLDIDQPEELEMIKEALKEKCTYLQGNLIAYDESQQTIGLESRKLEISSLGKGDVREPFIVLEYEDGSRSSDFLFESSRVTQGKSLHATLPCAAVSDEDGLTLTIRLKERHHEVYLELDYHVYEGSDVLTKRARVLNKGNSPVVIHRLMSNQLDFDHSAYHITNFSGAWAREMNRSQVPAMPGSHMFGSHAGVSSNRMNPFFMVSEHETGETYGNCYGFNLIYSGDHMGCVETTGLNKMRVLQGIHPMHFRWTVLPEEVFESPESVMVFSDTGYSGISQSMHDFIRNHIVRGEWQYKERPILLNSWEAAYFDFNEGKLLKLAKSARDAGIELFVMDDGWFGQRDNDTCALGDWTVNLKKLPNGIKGLSDKIHALDMQFGIWVEPEMVSEDSDCYRQHPEWAMKVPGQHQSLGRHQYILDLTREEVQNFLIQSMSDIFKTGGIDYVKWDMNRIFTDIYSSNLAPYQQGECLHRYYMGLYRVMRILTETFPHILFESCASGGNRFDLGMLCYMPQIWASDNTDAISRLTIQEGYSFGYPPSVYTAHVSDCPNHQTLRNVPLATRFNVASFGVLGYECHLSDYSKDELQKVKEQVALYKKWRNVLQFGDFYRLSHPSQGNSRSWMMVSRDKSHAVCGVFQTLAEPNRPQLKLVTKGLDPSRQYQITNLPEKVDVRQFGSLINMVAPIHIKQDSLVHNIVAKYYKLDGEAERYTLSGQVLNTIGIALKQGFCGTGFDASVRVYPDFASRLYFMETLTDEK